MHLQKLNLINFKNYAESELVFSDKINCFVGNNGAGKTNVLDAIHYLSFCKSYFNPIDSQSIRHSTDFFAIRGTYRNSESTDSLYSCIQKRNSKKVFKENKKDYDRLADHIGKIPLVMISPYDRDLINDGSEVRRKYIDSVISQFERIYLNDLISYNKALLQRNTLLKRFAEQHNFDADTLLIWDEKLAGLGTIIHAKRKSFLNEFNPLFNDYYQFLSGGKEEVEIQYESQMHDDDLLELLKTNQHKDRMVRYTTCGIHKDDLSFTIDGYPVKKYGSQGQQKSFVIAIKLAQFEYTRRIKKFKPILLFDDIFDKLDDSRVQSIISLVSENNFGQIFITDTQKQRIEKIFKEVNTDHKIFAVDNGKVQTIDD